MASAIPCHTESSAPGYRSIATLLLAVPTVLCCAAAPFTPHPFHDKMHGTIFGVQCNRIVRTSTPQWMRCGCAVEQIGALCWIGGQFYVRSHHRRSTSATCPNLGRILPFKLS